MSKPNPPKPPLLRVPMKKDGDGDPVVKKKARRKAIGSRFGDNDSKKAWLD